VSVGPVGFRSARCRAGSADWTLWSVRGAGPRGRRDDPSTIWDVAAHTYPWLLATLAILLISTVPGLGPVAEPLRIVGCVLCAIGIAWLVIGYRAIRKTGRTERKEEKEAAKTALLPYDSGPHAWIGSGYSYANEVDRRGSVRIDNQKLAILKSDGEQLGAGSIGTVRFERVPVWLGLGVRVRLGDGAGWYVQPHYEPTSPMTGWRATRRLKAALLAAQAAQGLGGRP